MKSIKGVSVVLGICLLNSTFAADKRDQQRAAIEAIKADLKPLRERAYLEPEVIASRKTLDDAYRAYWESVRVAMARLDPSKKKLIDTELKARKEMNAVASGSRAEDHARKAAGEKNSASEKAVPAPSSPPSP